MSQLMAKDLGLAMEAAVANQTSTPMGSLARNLFNFHNGQGNGQKISQACSSSTKSKIRPKERLWS